MEYSISQISKQMNLTTSTLRYYEKEGLLPTITRNKNGVRVFSENDIKTLNTIECLKKTGMPIKDIKKYMILARDGDSTLKERYNLILERKTAVKKQIDELVKISQFVDYKCWYYETAIKAGTESIHDGTTCENDQ